jgi:hypothetical protein
MKLLTDVVRWTIALLLAGATMVVALAFLRTGFAEVAERTAAWALGWKLLIWAVPGMFAITLLSALVGRAFTGAAALVRQRAALLKVVSTVWLVACCLWLIAYLIGPFAYGWAFLPQAWLSTTVLSGYLLWLAFSDYFILQLGSDTLEKAAATTPHHA